MGRRCLILENKKIELAKMAFCRFLNVLVRQHSLDYQTDVEDFYQNTFFHLLVNFWVFLHSLFIFVSCSVQIQYIFLTQERQQNKANFSQIASLYWIDNGGEMIFSPIFIFNFRFQVTGFGFRPCVWELGWISGDLDSGRNKQVFKV